MVPSPSPPSWESVRVACKEVLSTNSCQLWGEFKMEVAKRLEVSVKDIKSWNTEMKEMIAGGNSDEDNKENSDDVSEEEGEDSHGEEEGDSEDNEVAVSSEEDTQAEQIKRKPADGKDESEAMKAFKLLARAMGLG